MRLRQCAASSTPTWGRVSATASSASRLATSKIDGRVAVTLPARGARDSKAVAAALKELRRVAKDGGNIMPASITCAKAGVTTGEWGWTLREAFG